MSGARDKTDIGVAPGPRAVMEDLIARGWFADNADIGRLAFATALRAGVGPGNAQQVTTVWATGNFDKDGALRALIDTLYPETTTPVRTIEHLVNKGLIMLGERLSSNSASPLDLIDG